jgi:hypothetical protein
VIVSAADDPTMLEAVLDDIRRSACRPAAGAGAWLGGSWRLWIRHDASLGSVL